MNYFVFENPGVIDPRSITTFGVSSKDNASKAIGFFGTGLKYAIAILLRNGCGITIYSGGKKYTFGVFKEEIRNDTFQIVTMNNVKLGFTTELGKTWEMWQALRELHCNCVDENGVSYDTTTLDSCCESSTKIVIQGVAFEDEWRERHTIFLNTEPFITSAHVNVHHGESEYIYYRGIRGQKLSGKSLFTYDIQEKMDLTEDRTFKYPWYAESHVSRTLVACEDEKFIEKCITQGETGAWERTLILSPHTFGPTFEKVALRLIKDFRPNLNRSVLIRMREASFEKIVSDDTDKMTEIDKKRLAKATEFLSRLGWDVTKYPIIVSENIGENVLGRAHEGKIYIAQRTFMMGTKMLAGTLLEEYIHLKTGMGDCERSMQNWLFDALMSMGEQVTGEVL